MPELKSKKIVVVGKYRNSDMSSFVQDICSYLQNLGFEPHLDKETKELNHLSYKEADLNNPEQYGLCVAIGGDGTMMGACRVWGMLGVPVVGVNQGRVGFLTDISANNVYELLGEILRGSFYLESRNVLKVSVFNEQNELVSTGVAVNDFV